MKREHVIKKISKGMDKLIKNSLVHKFTNVSEEVREVIIAEYDEELVDVVTDRKSKTNPNLYRDEFIERLESYTYVKYSGDVVTLSVPDMETFDFSGRLRVIESIMRGLTGIYVEINEEDYIKVFGKRPVNQEPIDNYVSPKDRIYLVKHTGKIKRSERELKKKFVRYPFSNTAPIEILEEGQKFVDENINMWTEEAITEAQKVFALNYKGAKL